MNLFQLLSVVLDDTSRGDIPVGLDVPEQDGRPVLLDVLAQGDSPPPTRYDCRAKPSVLLEWYEAWRGFLPATYRRDAGNVRQGRGPIH